MAKKGELLQESIPFKLIIEESSNGRMVAKGQFGAVDIPTANNRIYPRTIMEREVKRLVKDASSRRLYGELDHPGDGKTKLSRSSHLITHLEVQEDGAVIGEAEILNTRNGKELKAIQEQGGQVGISSRGYGSVKTTNEGLDEVQDDFTLMTYDFVADPAAGGSYPEFSSGTQGDGDMVKKNKDNVNAEEAKVKGKKTLITSDKDESGNVEESLVGKDSKELTVQHEEEIADLKESFKNQLSEAMSGLTDKIRGEVQSELMSDPKVAGAVAALESVKTSLRPYILEADVHKELSVRESRISDLKTQLESLGKEKKDLEVKVEEFSEVTRELGFSLFLERTVGGNKKRDSIIEKVGDVNGFENLESLKHRVDTIVSEYNDAEEEVSTIRNESKGKVKVLESRVETLEEQLNKSLKVGKNFGIQAYLRERVMNHPRGKEILNESRYESLESKENVDEFVSKYRVVKKNVNEEYRSRVRRFMNKDSCVEENVKGTRVVDRNKKIEENRKAVGVSNPLSDVPGASMEDVERLSR